MVAKSWTSIISDTELNTVAKNRSKAYITVSGVRFDKVPEYEQKGYKEISRSSRTARMRLDKDNDEVFEDEVWNCLHAVGFKYMSDGRNFCIPVNDDPESNPKQIDVFAYDGNIALVIECKCADNPDTDGRDHKNTVGLIRKDMEYITKEVRKHFNNNDIQVGFVLATKNYKLGQAVKREAKINKVSLINENDLVYYKKLTAALGNHARYQILSDIFKDCVIPLNEVKIPAMRTYNGDIAMYSFMVAPEKLLPLAYVDRHRTNEDDDFSYQRFIQRNKIKEIKKYVQEGGFFPNNIIINIESGEEEIFEPDEDGDEQLSTGILTLPGLYRSVRIIDGQHRLFGYTDTEEASKSVVPVTAFNNVDKEFQSKIFIDINSNQKKVDPSLLQVILARSNMKSDDPNDWADALNTVIFQELNDDQSSPLYHKIKESSEDSDRDLSIKSLRDVTKKTKLISSTSSGGTFIPGPLYMDKEDKRENTKLKASKFFKLCFNIFKETCSENWETRSREGGYLCTKNGMTSLILTINECIRIQYKGKEDQAIKDSPETIFNQIKRYLKTLADYFQTITIDELDEYRQQYGAAGQLNCHNKMLIVIHNKYSQFTNEKIEKYLRDSDSKYADGIKTQLPELENSIIEKVKDSLLYYYGSGWHRVEAYKNIGKELNNLRYESGEDNKAIEDFIDIEKAYELIMASDWNKFKPYFKVKNPEGGKSKEADTAWINVIRTLRHKIDTKQVLLKDDFDLFEPIEKALRYNFTLELKSEEIDKNGD